METVTAKRDLAPLAEAATELGISVTTIRRRISTGEIAAMVDGRNRRRLLVSKSDVQKTLEPRPAQRVA